MIIVEGDEIAAGVGDVKVSGVVLVGALSTLLPFGEATWDLAIARNVPANWLELNLEAFAAGRRVATEEAV